MRSLLFTVVLGGLVGFCISFFVAPPYGYFIALIFGFAIGWFGDRIYNSIFGGK